jgi:thiol:disulfide interchange protein DsbD
MIPGLWGAPLKLISAFPPPSNYSEAPSGFGGSVSNGTSQETTADMHLGPQDIQVFHDLDKAKAYALKVGKPLFVDFTGHNCVNCRKMEEKVWSDPTVLKLLKEKFVVVSLYVDDKKIKLQPNEFFKSHSTGKQITTLGDKNAELQEYYFGKTTQPLYCLLDANEELVQPALGADYFQFEVEPFKKFLEEGIAEYSKRSK